MWCTLERKESECKALKGLSQDDGFTQHGGNFEDFTILKQFCLRP
jgi:hypothetical protein